MSSVVNVHEMTVQVHFAVVEVYPGPGLVHVDAWVLLAMTVVVVAMVEG